MSEDLIQKLMFFSSFILLTALMVHFRLKKKELDTRGSSAELGAEVDALRNDVDDTRAQLAEMQERLEFTERLLAAGRESQEDKTG
jgi:uncharacterized protein YlxW (UPF0749 family)